MAGTPRRHRSIQSNQRTSPTSSSPSHPPLMAAFIPPPPPPRDRDRRATRRTTTRPCSRQPSVPLPANGWVATSQPASQPTRRESTPQFNSREATAAGRLAPTRFSPLAHFLFRGKRGIDSAGLVVIGTALVCVCEKGVGLSSPTPLLAVERAAAAAAGAGRALRTCPFLLCLSLLWTRRR
ncbi:hypothetical protein DAI22_01g283500 [Oryza sativa Japonica Group]|nr:hypothetical protein DAI22_01g283500 [Oryza sativa Japonica Group]